VRAMRADLGSSGWWIAVGVFLAIVALAFLRLTLARNVYLGIAYAHGHIEIVAAVVLVLRTPSRST